MARKHKRLPPGARSPYEVADWSSSSAAETASEQMRIVREYMNQMYNSNLFVTDAAAPAKPADKRDAAYRAAREEVEKYLLKTTSTTGWDDVVGNDRARTALLEAIEHPVTHAELYKAYDMKPAKGVLLYGAPGCGKTMFGKAAAGALARLHKATDVEMLVINGPEIEAMYVGQTEQTIRQIFAYAREYHRVFGHQLVIFVDEADSILPARDHSPWFQGSNVATFLTEMDGLNANGAFVILATNRPEHLDQALLRDGRCDRKIKVERPDAAAAIEIMRRALTGPLAGVDPVAVVEYLFDPKHLIYPLTNPETKLTHHFQLSHIVSGAMIVGLVNRAKGLAFRRDMALGGAPTGVTPDDLRTAVDEVFAENKGLNHDYAMREFVETVAIPFEQAKAMRQALN